MSASLLCTCSILACRPEHARPDRPQHSGAGLSCFCSSMVTVSGMLVPEKLLGSWLLAAVVQNHSLQAWVRQILHLIACTGKWRITTGARISPAVAR